MTSANANANGEKKHGLEIQPLLWMACFQFKFK